MRKNNLLLITLIFIASLFLISSCTQKTIEEPKTEAECNTDLDCATAGCSGQLCISKDKAQDIITTCEFKEEYECLKLSSCSCIDNKCQWQENNKYLNCIENTK